MVESLIINKYLYKKDLEMGKYLSPQNNDVNNHKNENK